MQLGMIGLGRMGANIARRLMSGGHEFVVYDVNAGRGRAARKPRARPARRSLEEFVAKLRRAARGLDHGARPRSSRRSSTSWSSISSRATRSSTAATATTATTSTAPRRSCDEGHPLRRRRHVGRRLRPRARLLPDDRRRERGRRTARADLRARSRRASTRAERTAGQVGRPVAGRAGLPALRAERRRSLREDGAQRHRVRAHGRLRRRPERAAQGGRRQAADATRAPRQAPLREPEYYQYDIEVADVAEVWRRGSVVASWLLDLTAHALSGRRDARRLRRPRLRLGRGALDSARRGRGGRPGARPVDRALRTLQLARRGAVRRQAALCHAQGVRRPHRARSSTVDPRGRHRRHEHATRTLRRRSAFAGRPRDLPE